MAISDEHRERFEFLGRDKVRDLLANSMMVQHLVMPAWHWLEELADADKPPEAGVEYVHTGDASEPVKPVDAGEGSNANAP